MSKKFFMGMLFVLIMALVSAVVLADTSINITNTEISLSGTSGMETGYIEVQNIGSESVNVSFQPTILADDAGKIIYITGLETLTNLGPTDKATEDFKVNLSNYVGNYSGSITASVVGFSGSDSVPVKVQVLDNTQGLTITNSLTDSSQADKVVQQKIIVDNQANKDIVANIQKSGYDELTFTLNEEGDFIFPALTKTEVIASVLIPAGFPVKTHHGSVTFTVDSIPFTTALTMIVEPTRKASVVAPAITVDPGSSGSSNIQIKNTGNINLTGLQITNIAGFTDNDGDIMNISVSPNSSIDVNVGHTKTVSLKASASSKMDSGTYEGTLRLSGSGMNAVDFNVKVVVRDILQIVDVDLDDDTVKVGDKIKFSVEVENIAREVDLKDVKITAWIMDGSSALEDDDGDDLKEEADKFDLDSEDSDTEDFEFTMPYHVDDGDSFTIKVEVTGKNADDSSEEYTVYDESTTVDAEKEDHKLELYGIRLDSNSLSCSRSTYLHVGVRNIGDSNEDDVELSIENAELGISNHILFDIGNDVKDKDNEVEKSFLLNLKDAPEGSYEMRVHIYYNNDDDEEENLVPIEIRPCSGSTSSSGSTGSGSSYVPPSTPTNQDNDVQFTYAGSSSDSGIPSVTAAASPRITSTVPKKSWTDSIAFLVLVGIANLLLVVMIIVVIIYMVKK